MKKFYNIFIKWTFAIIAVLFCAPLLIIKAVILFIIKVAKIIVFIQDELFNTVMRITDGLEKMLRVKD